MTTLCIDSESFLHLRPLPLPNCPRNKQPKDLDVIYTTEKDALEMFMLEWCLLLHSWIQLTFVGGQSAA